MGPNQMCCYELRVLARKEKIKGYYVMKKAELALALGLGPIPGREKNKGQKCEHGKQRRFCVECGGSGVCSHGIRKYVCKICGGSQICRHGRQKHQCRECIEERTKPGTYAIMTCEKHPRRISIVS